MTTKQKLYAISESEARMDAKWHKPFTLKTALEWFLDGRNDCCPTQASGLLKCDPYKLNVKAKALESRGIQQISSIRFHFSGCDLRLNMIDLMVYCGWSEDDLQRRRMQSVTAEMEENECEKERLSASF